MSQALIKYEAACRAIAECKSTDEVKSWADKAAAMQAYGRMAKDRTLEGDAAEIRIRAERRLGEMLSATKAEGGLNKDANLRRGPEVVSNDLGKPKAPKLADAGISKDLSSRAQKLAAVPAAEFEAELAAKRERERKDGAKVSARLEKSGERHIKKARRELPAKPGAEFEIDDLRATVQALSERNDDLEARVAVESMDASEEEKTSAANLIVELKSQIKTLEAEADALRSMRNSLMTENAELKRSVSYWRGKSEKVAA